MSAKGVLGNKEAGVAAEAAAQIKLNLKDDPTFRRKLQERLEGHVGALVRDVHAFFGECILALQAQGATVKT